MFILQVSLVLVTCERYLFGCPCDNRQKGQGKIIWLCLKFPAAQVHLHVRWIAKLQTQTSLNQEQNIPVWSGSRHEAWFRLILSTLRQPMYAASAGLLRLEITNCAPLHACCVARRAQFCVFFPNLGGGSLGKGVGILYPADCIFKNLSTDLFRHCLDITCFKGRRNASQQAASWE